MKALQMNKFVNEMDQIIQCSPNELNYIKNYSELTQTDYYIYDKLVDKFNLSNRFASNPLKPIKKRLLNREIANQPNFAKKFTSITYNGLFSWIKNYYDSTKTCI